MRVWRVASGRLSAASRGKRQVRVELDRPPEHGWSANRTWNYKDVSPKRPMFHRAVGQKPRGQRLIHLPTTGKRVPPQMYPGRYIDMYAEQQESKSVVGCLSLSAGSQGVTWNNTTAQGIRGYEKTLPRHYRVPCAHVESSPHRTKYIHNVQTSKHTNWVAN